MWIIIILKRTKVNMYQNMTRSKYKIYIKIQLGQVLMCYILGISTITGVGVRRRESVKGRRQKFFLADTRTGTCATSWMHFSMVLSSVDERTLWHFCESDAIVALVLFRSKNLIPVSWDRILRDFENYEILGLNLKLK